MKYRTYRNGVMLMALVTTTSFALECAKADTIIVNNLTSAGNFAVSGLKNAQDTSYGQGFISTVSGNLNSFVLDLGLQSNSGSQSSGIFVSPTETVSFSLWSANSSGTPIAELDPLVSGITATEIENGGTYLGYVQNNDSFVYQYSLSSSLLSNPAIAANTDYAIVMTTGGSSQDIGWAEETNGDPQPAGEVGQLDPLDGYARMELDLTSATPEPSSWVLGVGACLVFASLRMARRPSAART
jgi:hypothetical protein